MLAAASQENADWLLDIRTMAPTPEKSKQLRKTSVEQPLKRNRIRRIDAETVLRTSRQPAIKVAEGFATPLTSLMSYVPAWMRRPRRLPSMVATSTI
jgi:hypothetical protein